MTRSADTDEPITWSWGRVIIAYLAIFWVVPFLAMIAAAGLAGDCNWESETCAAGQPAALFVAVALVFFWIFVSAPLTLLLGVGWLVRWMARLPTPGRAEVPGAVADGVPPGRADDAVNVDTSDRLVRAVHPAGVRESHVWAFAVVIWWLVLLGIAIVVTGDETSYPGLAAATFGMIMALPLTLMLVVNWLARSLSRQSDRRRGASVDGPKPTYNDERPSFDERSYKSIDTRGLRDL